MLTARTDRRSRGKDALNVLRGIAVAAVLGVSVLFAGQASAQAQQGDWELNFYIGPQSAPDSDVEGEDPGGIGVFDFNADWDEKSFDNPLHYGIRATYWWTDTIGFGVELNHLKVYLDDDDLAEQGFSSFEFTDGLNILTANVMRRWPGQWYEGRLTPYVGAGAGLAIPHVDVESAGGDTHEYQVTGPAVAVMAGVSYSINDRWSLFTEYKGTYSWNDVDLDNGGSFETDIITNALNIGVGFNF